MPPSHVFLLCAGMSGIAVVWRSQEAMQLLASGMGPHGTLSLPSWGQCAQRHAAGSPPGRGGPDSACCARVEQRAMLLLLPLMLLHCTARLVLVGRNVDVAGRYETCSPRIAWRTQNHAHQTTSPTINSMTSCIRHNATREQRGNMTSQLHGMQVLNTVHASPEHRACRM